jgi:DNA-binding transcriptional regulator YiaG
MRVSVKALQNWEQHRRNPTGLAAALLKIVATAPEVALKSLHG